MGLNQLGPKSCNIAHCQLCRRIVACKSVPKVLKPLNARDIKILLLEKVTRGDTTSLRVL